MKNIYKLFMLFIISTLAGCIEDNSNYDYAKIEKIKIITDGNYEVVARESVVISVEFDFEKAPDYKSEYTYEWSVDNQQLASTESSIVYTSPEIGSKNGLIVVTDVNTGAKYSNTFSIKVKPLYDGGFLVLSKEESNSRLHFIRRSGATTEDGNNQTYEYLKEYKNTYEYANGSLLEGTPVSLHEYYGFNAGDGGVYGEISITTNVGGENIITEVNGLSLKKELFITDAFASGIPKDFNPVKILHTCWDSYLLNDKGEMYTKRWAASNAYHTGFFDKDVTLWGSKSFDDLFMVKYSDLGVVFTIDKDPDTGERNFFAIPADPYRALDLKRVPLISEDPSYIADLVDIDYDVLFSDYVAISGEGGLFQIRKNSDNSLTASYKVFEAMYYRDDNIIVIDSKVFPLTDITNIIDMVTLKNQDNYAYICNDTNIYWYELETGKTGVVKSYAGKKIKSIALQSYLKYADYSKPVQMAIAFDDGSVEISEFAYGNNKTFSKTIFTSKENYGEIVDVIYKMGDAKSFF